MRRLGKIEHISLDGVLQHSAADGAFPCSELTSPLLEHGLADEVLLAVYPILLGTGKRCVAEGTPARSFELASTQACPSGIIFSTDRFAGALKTG